MLAILLSVLRDGAHGSQAPPHSTIWRRPQGGLAREFGRTRAMIVMGGADKEDKIAD